MKKRAKTRLWVLALIPAMLSLLPWVAVAQRAGTEGATQQADHLLLDYTHLIGKPEVKKELGITAQQLDELVRAETQSNKLIRDLGNRLEELKASGKSAQEMGKYNEVERPKTFAAMHQLYLDVLTASQRKRLKEIALQHIGGRALLYTDIQSALGVSPEQQKRIAKTVAIFREGMDRTRKAHDSAFRDNFRNPRAINALPPQEMAEYARIENELPVASGARKTELLIRKRALEDKVGYHKTFDEQKRKQLEKEWAVREQEFKVKWDKILSEQGRALMNELSLWQKSRLKDLQGKPLFIQ